MQKRDTLAGAPPAASLTEGFKCRECLHFQKFPHSKYERPCELEGILGTAVAPRCFTPDVTLLTGNSDQFVQLASLFQSYDHKQRRVLLALLREKKKSFVLGTKLYFYIGDDFLSNYLSAYVAGYTSDGRLLLIGSPDQKSRGSSFVTFTDDKSDGLLTHSQWKQKKASLLEAGRIYDPLNKRIKKGSVLDDYEAPTIDTVPDYVYNKGEPGDQPRRRKSTDEISFQVS
jgi:hypothetical protein